MRDASHPAKRLKGIMSKDGKVKTNLIKVGSVPGNAWAILAKAGEIAAEAMTVKREIERILTWIKNGFILFLLGEFQQGRCRILSQTQGHRP